MKLKSIQPITFTEMLVQAGFPSPAEDFSETKLNLNEYLISNPAATFFIRVSGDSMEDSNIFSNDLLIVDRSLTAKNGDIIVALINGEFTVKHLELGKITRLVAANPRYAPITITEENEFQVWGVVSYVIHRARRL